MDYIKNGLTVHISKLSKILGEEQPYLEQEFRKYGLMSVYEEAKSRGGDISKLPPSYKKLYLYNNVVEFFTSVVKKKEAVKKVFSFYIHKGGTGKTTSCFNIASYLALLGYKVLLIDLDTQCNLTQICGISTNQIYNLDYTIKDLICRHGDNGFDINDYIFNVMANIDLISGDPDIYEAEAFLNKRPTADIDKPFLFKNIVEKNNLKDKYDFIFFDNHSSPSMFLQSSYMIIDGMITPAIPECFSLEALKTMKEDVLDPVSEIRGEELVWRILLNNVDVKNQAHLAALEEITEEFHGNIFGEVVKPSTDFANSIEQQAPFYCFSSPNSNALKDYKGLVGEFVAMATNSDSCKSANNINQQFANH